MVGCARFRLFFMFGWQDILGLGCDWCLGILGLGCD